MGSGKSSSFKLYFPPEHGLQSRLRFTKHKEKRFENNKNSLKYKFILEITDTLKIRSLFTR